MTLSLCINHTPWVPERVEALTEMLGELLPLPPCTKYYLHNIDYRGWDWQNGGKLLWMLAQWQWSVAQPVDHHVFLTDDLHIMPGFWNAVHAMLSQSADAPVGLLSNHPEIPSLTGFHWYRTNSWLTGPGYILPHKFLVGFLEWFAKMPDHPHTTPGTKSYQNDDSNINLYVSHLGSYTLHPLPTVIEHRHDLASTVGHGDKFSRERLSWRARRWTEEANGGFEWKEDLSEIVRALNEPGWWIGPETSPLLRVGA